MQLLKGTRAFHIAPRTFVLPAELAEFRAHWARDRSGAWIVKPAASSQGRGIHLVTHPSQVAWWRAWFRGP